MQGWVKRLLQKRSNNTTPLKIENGFQIEMPEAFVPWGIDENELIKILSNQKLKHVTDGYYTLNCQSLNGLKCLIGFHFEPRKDGRLRELEFFRSSYSNLSKSFNNFQSHFEIAFGKPTTEAQGTEGFKNYAWNFSKVQIIHYVFDRFGPEEHMRIKWFG